jgi:hypothetical protein
MWHFKTSNISLVLGFCAEEWFYNQRYLLAATQHMSEMISSCFPTQTTIYLPCPCSLSAQLAVVLEPLLLRYYCMTILSGKCLTCCHCANGHLWLGSDAHVQLGLQAMIV